MRLSAYRVALVMLSCTNEVALAANPDNGSTLAQRWCTGCHVVADDQIKGADIAPSFASIAERPDYNVEKLASFLLEPHPKKPNMALSPEEAKDISLYCRTAAQIVVVPEEVANAREVTEQSKAISANSLLALAVGAAAFGAVAIGVLAIGRLAVGRLVIKKARFSELEVDDLTAHRLRVVEHNGQNSRCEGFTGFSKARRCGIASPRAMAITPRNIAGSFSSPHVLMLCQLRLLLMHVAEIFEATSRRRPHAKA